MREQIAAANGVKHAQLTRGDCTIFRKGYTVCHNRFSIDEKFTCVLLLSIKTRRHAFSFIRLFIRQN